MWFWIFQSSGISTWMTLSMPCAIAVFFACWRSSCFSKPTVVVKGYRWQCAVGTKGGKASVEEGDDIYRFIHTFSTAPLISWSTSALKVDHLLPLIFGEGNVPLRLVVVLFVKCYIFSLSFQWFFQTVQPNPFLLLVHHCRLAVIAVRVPLSVSHCVPLVVELDCEVEAIL